MNNPPMLRVSTTAPEINSRRTQLSLHLHKYSLPKEPFLQPSRLVGGKAMEEVDDLILLPAEEITMDHVLDHVESRYRAKKIYTYIGPVLIAVNPYSMLTQPADRTKTIYDLGLLQAFSGRQLHEVAPHPYALAESAYSQLIRHATDQCILITGTYLGAILI